MRIGVLLGSFDPIHTGHLCMATAVLNENMVDEVLIVPSVQNVWKDKPGASFEHRIFMIQLATEELRNCRASGIDCMTANPHYSYQTLQAIQQEYEGDELFLIVGADVVDSIKDWMNGEWILDNFKVIVIGRGGETFKSSVHDYIAMNIDISSTDIRSLIKCDGQIYPKVPKVISQYIHKYNLYKKG